MKDGLELPPEGAWDLGKEPLPKEQEYSEYRDWPLALSTFVEQPDGSWRVRLRCPDGSIQKFRSRAKPSTPASRERSAMKPDVRFAVLSRDAFRCRYCGRAAPDVALHVDHVVAIANGGKTEMGNLVAACADCNVGKGVQAAG